MYERKENRYEMSLMCATRISNYHFLSHTSHLTYRSIFSSRRFSFLSLVLLSLLFFFFAKIVRELFFSFSKRKKKVTTSNSFRYEEWKICLMWEKSKYHVWYERLLLRGCDKIKILVSDNLFEIIKSGKV